MQGEMQATILLQSNKDQNPLNPSIEPVDWWNRKKKTLGKSHQGEAKRERLIKEGIAGPELDVRLSCICLHSAVHRHLPTGCT